MRRKNELTGSCAIDTTGAGAVRNPIDGVVRALSAGFKGGQWASHIEPVPIPSKCEIIDLIEQAQRILFPGFFSPVILRPENLDYHLGQQVSLFYENLASQVSSAIRHDCFRHDQNCSFCGERSYQIAADLIDSLPTIRNLLETDIEATLTGDPAATNSDEVIFSYPGLFATMVYRLAHRLHELGVPLVPRIMSEHAYHRTAIDINPAAEIGSHFFIDHGSGVVVGATTSIGDRVRAASSLWVLFLNAFDHWFRIKMVTRREVQQLVHDHEFQIAIVVRDRPAVGFVLLGFWFNAVEQGRQGKLLAELTVKNHLCVGCAKSSIARVRGSIL